MLIFFVLDGKDFCYNKVKCREIEGMMAKLVQDVAKEWG
jgi:hypothetical protein